VANYPPLQVIGAAVYARLNDDATLTALAPVVNDEAEFQAHPFVLVPGANSTPWNTLGGYGWECEITPVVYSQYEGDLEAIQIGERVMALLNFYALAVTGYTTVICELDPDMSPVPVKTSSETKQKIERRAMAIRFRIRVHE
jgi:hypothetical protein